MAADLKEEKENKKTAAACPVANGSRKERGDGPADRKLINKGATTTSPDDGKKYMWCQHHGTNKGKYGKQTGMYMMAPHKHAEWLANKKKKSEA